MSELKHPAISANAEFFLTPEEEFAKLAYEALAHYGVMCDDISAGVSYPVTERVEISEDNETSLRALRLRRTVAIPILEVGQSAAAGGLSDEYVVLELQHGEVSYDDIDSSEPVVDQDFTWSPYVVAIFKTGGEDDYELDVVDGSTGEALSLEDLFTATHALRYLGTWLYLEQHENGLEKDGSIGLDTVRVEQPNMDNADDFDPEKIDLNYSCSECGQDNGICDHNIPKMN